MSKQFVRVFSLTKQIGTWSLEARHTANTIHISCGRLWGEIRWRGTRPASQKHTQGTLQTHLRLDRNTLHWDHIGLGLQKTTSEFINFCKNCLFNYFMIHWLNLSARRRTI